MQNKVRVFLADSQVVFREGMHFVLEGEEGIEVVGEGGSAEEALAFLSREAMDVLVLNEDMAEMARRIRLAFPAVRLIFVGNFHPSDARVGDGKSVFLSRDMDPRELAAAIRQAGGSNTQSRDADLGKGMDATMKALREHLLSLVESL